MGDGLVGRLEPEDDEPMHGWFGLSYANYLAIPRTLIQSMPAEWQRRLHRCLKDLEEASRDVPQAPTYHVHAADWNGRYMHDPMPHYQRGRTRVPLWPYEPS